LVYAGGVKPDQHKTANRPHLTQGTPATVRRPADSNLPEKYSPAFAGARFPFLPTYLPEANCRHFMGEHAHTEDEALSLLGSWRNEGTRLRIHASGAGFRQDLQGTIRELKGTVVEIRDDRTKLQFDLQGADFNWGSGSARRSRAHYRTSADRSLFRLHDGKRNSSRIDYLERTNSLNYPILIGNLNTNK
jgi:hypothetical protein